VPRGPPWPQALLLDENHAFYAGSALILALAVITIPPARPRSGRYCAVSRRLNLASVAATYRVIVLVWRPAGSHAIWACPTAPSRTGCR
jgi:hypothetical protein